MGRGLGSGRADQRRHGAGGDPLTGGRPGRPLAGFALAGFTVFALASAGLALVAESPFLFFLERPFLHVPAAGVAAAAAAFALRRADGRLLAGAGAVGVVLLASARSGLPSTSGWALAIVGGLGLLVYVENAFLLVRIERVQRAEGTEAGLPELVAEMRRAEVAPLVAVLVVLVFGVVAAPWTLLLFDASLAASLEAAGGYGLVAMTALAVAVALGFNAARTSGEASSTKT